MAGNFFYLDRGLVSIDILCLIFLRQIIRNGFIAVLFIMLFCLDFLTSLAYINFGGMEGFYSSWKFFFSFQNWLSICIGALGIVVAIFLATVFLLKRSRVTISTKIGFAFLLAIIVLVDFASNTTEFSSVQSISSNINVATSASVRNISFFINYLKFKNSPVQPIKKVTTPFRVLGENIRNGINDKSVKEKPNVVLIIMESFGFNRDASTIKDILSPLQELKDSFVVDIYKSRFYGGTEAAETRELLGLDGILFDKIISEAQQNIQRSLPQDFLDIGYKTIGIHGFSGHNFNRIIWWKEIGFQEEVFATDLHRIGYPLVGTFFRGIFDLDALDFLLKMEKDLQIRNESFFIYLLTLNAHLPFSMDLLNKYGIDKNTNEAYSIPQLMNQVQKKIVIKIVDVIKQSPNTIFVFTGDHKPRMSKKDGALFDKYYVPSIIACPVKYRFLLENFSQNNSAYAEFFQPYQQN